jgi:uncharacterized protein (TIGR02598 family)
MKTAPSRPQTLRPFAGFTLVEVCLSLGVLAVAATTMMGLMPGSLSQLRESIDRGQAQAMSAQVLVEARQMDFAELCAQGSYERYFTEDGTLLPSRNGSQIYTAKVSVNRGNGTPLPGGDASQPSLASLKVEIRKTPPALEEGKEGPLVGTYVSRLACRDLSELNASR